MIASPGGSQNKMSNGNKQEITASSQRKITVIGPKTLVSSYEQSLPDGNKEMTAKNQTNY